MRKTQLRNEKPHVDGKLPKINTYQINPRYHKTVKISTRK